MKFLIFILLQFSLWSTFAQTSLVPVISSEQLQVGRHWTWSYYEEANAQKLYSSERYTVVARRGDTVTFELWTQIAGASSFTPSARFIVNLQDCWQAFTAPLKNDFQITLHAYEKNKWSVEGYKVASTAFEEKFNCNPKQYPSGLPNYETVYVEEVTPWGTELTFQQQPKRRSQLLSFYFLQHADLKGVAYRKRFNPLSPYEFEMYLTGYGSAHNSQR